MMAVDVLRRCFNLKDVVLGGGTVLASRWAHRLSTDLDFFIQPSIYRHAISELGNPVQKHLDEAIKKGEIENVAIRSGTMGFETGGTNVSVFTVESITGEPLSQREVNTGVWLESTSEILAKKIIGRVLKLGQFTLRDFYDICVARLKDRASFERVLSLLTDKEMEEITNELSHWRSSPDVKGAEKTSPLLNVEYKEIAENLWACSESVFKGGELHQSMGKYATKEIRGR